MASRDRWIVIPRWDEFQHRDATRTGRIPWIKTYTQLVNDDDYLSLSVAQRGILHGLWLLYASRKRVVSESGASRVLVRSESDARWWKRNLQALNHAGFIEFSASKPAGRPASHPASVEGEREEEPLTETARSTTQPDNGDQDDQEPVIPPNPLTHIHTLTERIGRTP